MRKRWMSAILVFALCLPMLLPEALAVETLSVTVGGVAVTAEKNSADYTSEYRIDSDGAQVELTGSTTSGRVIVDASNVTILLDGVSMQLNQCNGSPIEIAENGSATLVLRGANTLSAHAAGPGILVNQGATLTIRTDPAAGDASLTVSGAQMDRYQGGEVSGGLMSGFAGIGGPNGSSTYTYTGTINIESGTVNATGYGYGAGIGGGDYGSGGTIHISGGVVTAICGGTDPNGWASSTHKQGCGIGASQGQKSGTITISGDAEVTAYGGYGCAGIGGGTADVTVQDSAKVTAYGGELAAGIGGYNRDKGASTITISDSASVTAYGGSSASGLGQGSASSEVNLSIASSAEVTAYSDGTKAAITGIPSGGTADIVNLHMKNVTLPAMDLPLTFTGAGGETETVTLPAGYKALGTTLGAGEYEVSVNLGQAGAYRIIPAAGKSFEVIAGADSATYGGTQTMLLGISDGGASVQLNPPVGVTVSSGDGSPLVLNSEDGTILVPAGGRVGADEWLKGGTVSKDGSLAPNFDEHFEFETDLPSTASGKVGEPLTLSVAVAAPQDGGVLSYRWYRDGAEIPGETGASLTLENLTEAESGEYQVVVTKTLSGETVTLSSQVCALSVSADIPVTGISLDQTSLTLYTNAAPRGATLTAQLTPADATERDVVWSSSDERVAKVEDGTVTAVGAGTATVTVTSVDGGASTSCKVTVRTKGTSGEDSSSRSYTVQVIDAEHGTVTASTSSASRGTAVTVTVSPDDGYRLEELRVTDTRGNALALTDHGDGRYTFTMPAAGVTVEAVFTQDAFTCDGGENCPSRPFTDLDTGRWYHEAVDYVLTAGIMGGTSETTFEPESTTTRGMIVTMLYRLEGEPASAGSGFTDVAEGRYDTRAIAWASANGIVNGYGDGNFGPDDPITREQMATILYRYAAFKGADVSARADLSGYEDAAQIGAYARDAMAWANAEGLIVGVSPAELAPTGAASRAQIAAVFMRFERVVG